MHPEDKAVIAHMVHAWSKRLERNLRAAPILGIGLVTSLKSYFETF